MVPYCGFVFGDIIQALILTYDPLTLHSGGHCCISLTLFQCWMCHYRLLCLWSREARLQRNGSDFKMRGTGRYCCCFILKYLILEKWLGTSTFESIWLCDLHVSHTVSEKHSLVQTWASSPSHPVWPVLHTDIGTTLTFIYILYVILLWIPT